MPQQQQPHPRLRFQLQHLLEAELVALHHLLSQAVAVADLPHQVVAEEVVVVVLPHPQVEVEAELEAVVVVPPTGSRRDSRSSC